MNTRPIVTTEDRGDAHGRLLGRLAFAAGLTCGLVTGWLLLPQWLFGRQAQPLDFDHALHGADAGLACADCHAFRADGSFTGVPALAACTACHAEMLGESPGERCLVEEHVQPAREVAWLVYARQPQNVYFPHAAHVVLAELPCDRCHGDHGTTSSLPDAEFNRISTYSRQLGKMSDCSRCHAERGVEDSCLMCHR